MPDFHQIDTTVHGPIRLGILCALKINNEMDFTSLKKKLNASDGALGTHLQKLEDASLISTKKEFIGKRPRSSYKITKTGAASLTMYLDNMQKIIDSVE